MRDFSQWIEYSGASEGSGRSEKVWLMDPVTRQIGLFKYKKDLHTTDHISECIAYKLACLLGMECARFEVGIYNGREGSMSYNIITNEGQSLIEGISYIICKHKDYDVEHLRDKKSGEVYSLKMIEESLPESVTFKDFLKIVLFDYLIGNTDRHQSNWALIQEKEKLRFSPLYDNSSSLCAYLSDRDVEACIGNDNLKWKSVVETKSKSIIRITSEDEQRPTHLEVLRYVHDNFYEETKELALKITDCITGENIDKIMEEFEDNILAIKRKRVIKKFLLYKVGQLKEVYFQKEDQNVD